MIFAKNAYSFMKGGDFMFEYFKKSFGVTLGIGAGIVVSNMMAMMAKPETKKIKEDEKRTEEN